MNQRSIAATFHPVRKPRQGYSKSPECSRLFSSLQWPTWPKAMGTQTWGLPERDERVKCRFRSQFCTAVMFPVTRVSRIPTPEDRS
jgi:hypothetical protein